MTAQNALAVLAESIGGDLLPENRDYRNRMQIRSESSSRLYVVAQHRTTREWKCSCFGWIRYRRCKHLTAMHPALAAATRAGLLT